MIHGEGGMIEGMPSRDKVTVGWWSRPQSTGHLARDTLTKYRREKKENERNRSSPISVLRLSIQNTESAFLHKECLSEQTH